MNNRAQFAPRSAPLPAAQFGLVWPIALASLRVGFRDRTVIWLTAMFLAMVLVSAYLGWSATHTLDAIFQKAIPVLKTLGRAVPINPASEISPLSDLRNMTTYVSLLGALAAIVLGTQLIGADRKSGVLPLIASRPVSRIGLALGKILALVLAITGILLIAAAVNVVTMLLLPGQALNGADWGSLAKFYGVSALCLTAFGLLGLFCATVAASESLALLIPVTIWLAMTFVLPQLTGNINPMAALNPIKATLVPPGGSFFNTASLVLGPFSLIDAYRSLAATILGFAPEGQPLRPMLPGLSLLIGANFLLALCVLRAIWQFDASRSDYND